MTLKSDGKPKNHVSSRKILSLLSQRNELDSAVVGWELSVWALTNALAYLDTEEAQKFLDEHFVELMRILGMQK